MPVFDVSTFIHSPFQLIETFEKCSILPAQLNPYLIFNRGSRPRKAKILTRGIH
jgi:hypothetical protein